MNWDRVLGRWKQVKGGATMRWARLIADPSKELDGHREMLAGKLQVAYGVGRDAASQRACR